MAQKPDFDRLKQNEQFFISTSATVQSVLDNEKKQEEAIRTAIHLLKKVKAGSMLSSVPTSELSASKAGIRISALTDAGYTDLGQIASVPDWKLQRIPGIGEKQAASIRQILDTFRENYAKNAVISINPDENLPETKALLLALDRYIASQKVYRILRKNGKEFLTFTSQTIAAIQIRGSLGWLFSGREKKNSTAAAYAAMEAFRTSRRMQDLLSEMAEFQTAIGRSQQQAEENFRLHSADFYALLEKFGENKVNRRTIYNSVPEQLANEIDAEVLDLSYLRATLREYQVFGAKYALHQRKVLLGDEMGLGKTIQALALMCHLAAQSAQKESGVRSGANVETPVNASAANVETPVNASAANVETPAAMAVHFLVVCPASVLINWCREIRSKSDIPVHLIHGRFTDEAFGDWQKNGGAAVTNYETIRRIVDRIDNKMKIELLVIDEAHYIKNPDAQRTKLLRRLTDEAERILMMTGTALENRVSEMCALIDFVQPETAKQVRRFALVGNSLDFRTTAAPAYLRRVRSDVLKELPPITEEDQWLGASPEDFEAYRQQVWARNFMQMRRISFLGDAPADTSVKLTRILELCEEAMESNRKVVVFSYFRETLRIVEQALGERCIGVISGSTDPAQRQELVDRFTETEKENVLVCQISAGGTGLNMQAASIVIFCEPQIKPSLEMQAISRVYRMGQVNNVTAYHLLCEDTVDEAVRNILESKRVIFNEYADESALAQAADGLINSKWIAAYVEKEHQRLLPAVTAANMSAAPNTSAVPNASAAPNVLQEVPGENVLSAPNAT